MLNATTLIDSGSFHENNISFTPLIYMFWTRKDICKFEERNQQDLVTRSIACVAIAKLSIDRGINQCPQVFHRTSAVCKIVNSEWSLQQLTEVGLLLRKNRMLQDASCYFTTKVPSQLKVETGCAECGRTIWYTYLIWTAYGISLSISFLELWNSDFPRETRIT